MEEPVNEDEIQGDSEIPQTLEDFVAEMKDTRPDAKTFASRLKAMVLLSLFLDLDRPQLMSESLKTRSKYVR